MAKDRQSNWAAGELTPDLHGSAGSPVYQRGAALMRNFMVTPEALPVNRTGTQCLAVLGSQTARLETFLFGDDEARIVQMYGSGDIAMRTPLGAFAEVGADDTSGDTVSPSREAVLEALRRIRVAQCAGTMAIARTDFLKDLRRISATSYAIINVDYRRPNFGSSVIPYDDFTPSRTKAAIMTSATGYTVKNMAGDGTHPPRPWQYVVTRVVSIEDGNPEKPNQIIETFPYYPGFTFVYPDGRYPVSPVTYTVDSSNTYSAASVPNEIAVYGDWNMRLKVPGQKGDDWAEGSGAGAGTRTGKIVAHRIYRGRDGVFGYIGQTDSLYFVDDGRNPDIANPPPYGMRPLIDDSGATRPPIAVAFKDDRRFVAGTLQKPSTAQGSAVGNWSDFDINDTPDDADSIAFDLSANEHQSIRHLMALQALCVATSRAVFAITGNGDLGVLTPTSIAARKILSIGSAHYPAPVEGDSGIEGQNSAVFITEAKGGRPYAATMDGNGASGLVDLSLFSSHFFRGRRVVSWAWARDPFQTLWVALDDGSLLSLCFSIGAQVQGWAKHQLAGGGLVESVTTLPIGGEDLLYLVVRRGSQLTLERMTPQIVDDSRLECYLDCATIVDGRKAFGLTVDGVTEIPGGGGYTMAVTIGQSGGLAGGNAIQFPDANGNTVRATVALGGGTSWNLNIIDFAGETLNVSAGHSVAALAWGIDTSSVTTAGIANGSTVSAVIDGAVFEGLTVVGGSVALPVSGIVCIVGFPYVSQLQALAVEQDRGKQKQVARVFIETIGRGGQAGTNFSSLREIPPRNVSDGYGLIASRFERTELSVASSANKTAVVVIQQSQPKPFKILAVEREYVLGD